MSTFPIAVKRVRAEKGVIIAHPGKTSFAFRSIAQKIPSSSLYRLYKVFWCRDANNLHRQASLENFNCRQFANIRCCKELVKNIFANFWSSAAKDWYRVLTKAGTSLISKKKLKVVYVGCIIEECFIPTPEKGFCNKNKYFWKFSLKSSKKYFEKNQLDLRIPPVRSLIVVNKKDIVSASSLVK